MKIIKGNKYFIKYGYNVCECKVTWMDEDLVEYKKTSEGRYRLFSFTFLILEKKEDFIYRVIK